MAAKKVIAVDASLNKQIDALGKKTAKWRDDVQVVLVACAKQAFDHGNVDPFTRLIGVMGGADMKALIRWAEEFAPCVWMKSETKFRFNNSFEAEFDGLYLLGQAWWLLATKPAQVSSTYDVLEVVQEMIKRCEKEVKAGKKTVEHKDMIMELRKTVTAYEESVKKAKAA